MHSRGTLRDPPLPIPSCRWVAGVCCSHFLFSNLSCYFGRTSSLREQLASHWWCYHTISKLCAQSMLCGAPARVSRRDLRRTEKRRRRCAQKVPKENKTKQAKTHDYTARFCMPSWKDTIQKLVRQAWNASSTSDRPKLPLSCTSRQQKMHSMLIPCDYQLSTP